MTANDKARSNLRAKSKSQMDGFSIQRRNPGCRCSVSGGLTPNSLPTGRILGPELSVVYVNDEYSGHMMSNIVPS